MTPHPVDLEALSEGGADPRLEGMDTNTNLEMVEVHCTKCRVAIVLPHWWTIGALIHYCAKCAKKLPKRAPWDAR